jgi:hypothetical protein
LASSQVWQVTADDLGDCCDDKERDCLEKLHVSSATGFGSFGHRGLRVLGRQKAVFDPDATTLEADLKCAFHPLDALLQFVERERGIRTRASDFLDQQVTDA